MIDFFGPVLPGMLTVSSRLSPNSKRELDVGARQNGGYCFRVFYRGHGIGDGNADAGISHYGVIVLVRCPCPS